MKRLIISFVPLLLIPSACATSGEPGATASRGDCFNARMVSGFSSVNRNVVRLDAGPSRRYDVKLSGPFCDQINWANNIALETRPSPWICVGDRVGAGRIVFRDPTVRQRISCFIDDVQRVPPPAPRS